MMRPGKVSGRLSFSGTSKSWREWHRITGCPSRPSTSQVHMLTCSLGECGLVCGEKNRTRVRSGQYVPSKNHGASAPRNLRQVGARGGNARAQREEQGAALLRAFESSATRDSLKLGLMPFEIARTGHRISVASQECRGWCRWCRWCRWAQLRKLVSSGPLRQVFM